MTLNAKEQNLTHINNRTDTVNVLDNYIRNFTAAYSSPGNFFGASGVAVNTTTIVASYGTKHFYMTSIFVQAYATTGSGTAEVQIFNGTANPIATLIIVDLDKNETSLRAATIGFSPNVLLPDNYTVRLFSSTAGIRANLSVAGQIFTHIE